MPVLDDFKNTLHPDFLLKLLCGSLAHYAQSGADNSVFITERTTAAQTAAAALSPHPIGQFDFYRAAKRQAYWTVHTRTDGHIVIAARARIENQIGVVETDAIASGGRFARSFLPASWRAGTALGRGRAEARRTALLAREIGTTLLFIARLFLPLDATSIS
jgi:hypothetical protein